MAFGFLKGLWGPEAGRKAMRSSYDKHYKLALANNLEPIACGLYGALASRYKLRSRFISEQVHMVEISPFAMMRPDEGRDHLADYVLFQEIPNEIDFAKLRTAINVALRQRQGDISTDAYNLLVASIPYLQGSGIQWFSWLDDDNIRQLEEDAKRELG